MTERVGIIGYRSWIGRSLTAGLRRQGVVVEEVDKDRSVVHDGTGLSAMYVVPGRTHPDEYDMAMELTLVRNVALSHRPARRLVLLSSFAVLDDTPYGAHKRQIEAEFAEFLGVNRLRREGRPMTMVVRAPAVIGPDQDPDSKMLLPSLVREGLEMPLFKERERRQFCLMEDLVSRLSDFRRSEWDDHAVVILDGFKLSAHEVRGLLRAYEDLVSERERRKYSMGIG